MLADARTASQWANSNWFESFTEKQECEPEFSKPDRNASEQDACTPKKRSHQKTSGKPMASDIGRNAAATTVALNFPEFESFVF
jgi:hypothetical protein